MMSGITVSIIIPTYNDWRRLSLCIKALEKQRFPREQFEVLIVNNNPNDMLPADLLLPENFRVLQETKPGSYAARNIALKVARGAIVGFTDSDCIPDQDWIENAVKYLQENKNCSRIAGRVCIFSTSSPATISEKYDALYAFPQQLYVTKSMAGVTANLFTYKRVFDTVGYFDENLYSNGDLEWGRRAQKFSFPVHYVEHVMVQHPARSLQELIRKEKRIAGGRGMAERQWNTKMSNVFRLVNGFRPRLAEIKHIYANAAHLPSTDKIKLVLLRHYLLQIRAFELLKVQLGKKPNRA